MNKKYIYLAGIIIAIIALLGFFFLSAGSPKLSVNTSSGIVKISDIYKNPIDTFSNSDITYKKTADYSFDYYAKDQLFIITITDKDIKTAREKAENDFLSTLKIDKTQACKLNIQLGVPFSINQDAAGINFGLSFCPNGKSF